MSLAEKWTGVSELLDKQREQIEELWGIFERTNKRLSDAAVLLNQANKERNQACYDRDVALAELAKLAAELEELRRGN